MINKQRIETLYETRFLNCYDLQYEEGRQTMISHKELEEKIEELAPGRFVK